MSNNIALLSFFTPDFQPLHDVTGPNKDLYCARRGYRHIVKHTPYGGDPSEYYAFQRLRYIYDLLFENLEEGKGIEIILCINTHAQIMNHNTAIESFLDDHHDFYIHKDINGLNAGVFIVRKSEWSKKWIEFILLLKDTHQNHCWKEQKLMQDNWERPEFKDKIKVPEHPGFNSYRYDWYWCPETTAGHFKRGDFVLHVPGRSVLANQRDSLMESRIKIFSSPEVLESIIHAY